MSVVQSSSPRHHDADVSAPPLTCPTATFVTDPSLADAVDVGYERTAVHSATSDPNRYTVHVPTQTTRLSLGEKSARWNTDIGITGYTDTHAHFEVTKNDRTVVSLGGSATKSGLSGLAAKPPVGTTGYSMVTLERAWQDAKDQHVLISQTQDLSLRTMGGGKRAVVQSDEGAVDLTGGKEVNDSAAGVSVGAGELEHEHPGYDEEWEAQRPHSVAAYGARIATAAAAGVHALNNLVFQPARPKHIPGNFAPVATPWMDFGKRALSLGIFGASVAKVVSLASAKPASPGCVKLDAAEKLAGLANRDVSFFGMKSASLGAAGWATVSAGVSATLTGVVYAGVAGAFAANKGYRKAEVGSDWGSVVVGAKTGVHMAAEAELKAAAKETLHVASPGGGKVLVGGGKKTWLGGGAFGVHLDASELALGKAVSPKDLGSASIAKTPALRITKGDVVELTTTHATTRLRGQVAQIESKKPVRFEASGTCTVNGASVLLK